MESNNNYHQDAPENGGYGIPPEQSGQAFMEQFTSAPKPPVATGPTEATELPAIGEIPPLPDPVAAAGLPPVAAPIFAPPAAEPEEEEITVRKWSNKELEGNLEMFLNMRSLGQSRILAMISGDDHSKYELDQDQMTELARVWKPYFAKWGGKIPDWFWLIMAEGIIMYPMIQGAIQDRKINQANKKLAAQPAIQEKIQQATLAQVSRRTRKKYSINKDGLYIADAVNGRYLKKAEQFEKASLEDLELLLRDNDVAIVRAAFPDAVIPDTAS